MHNVLLPFKGLLGKGYFEIVFSVTHCFMNRILVGAPWDGPQNNRKGDIYKCIVGDEINSNCSKVNLGIE